MNKSYYIVEGLNNESTKMHLKSALENIKGVNGVCIDLGKNNLEIRYDNRADLEEIRDCIENTAHTIQ